jgi:hypothetical protein
VLAKVMKYCIKMIKYNIVVCYYNKILVNVAAYVIPGLVCVCGALVRSLLLTNALICAYVGI